MFFLIAKNGPHILLVLCSIWSHYILNEVIYQESVATFHLIETVTFLLYGVNNHHVFLLMVVLDALLSRILVYRWTRAEALKSKIIKTWAEGLVVTVGPDVKVRQESPCQLAFCFLCFPRQVVTARVVIAAWQSKIKKERCLKIKMWSRVVAVGREGRVRADSLSQLVEVE